MKNKRKNNKIKYEFMFLEKKKFKFNRGEQGLNEEQNQLEYYKMIKVYHQL